MRRSGSNLDFDLIRSEWGSESVKQIYFNSGSCGPKPESVLRALAQGLSKLNENPTLMTFYDEGVWAKARSAAAELFLVSGQDLMLTPNTTYGIQMVMQSLLLRPGDEFLSTDQEHGCVNTLSRYLTETRGIVVRSHTVDPFAGSTAFCEGILQLVSARTRLVLVSEINCLTGWRPRLAALVDELASSGIPLIVDGAHAPGQGPVQISSYPFWVASAHKWMGAPNGCGFLYVKPEYRDRLSPLTVGDRLYNESFAPLHRLEWPGTCDVVRLMGLEAALKLQLKLKPERIAERQRELHLYLRKALEDELPAGTVRTPWVEGETSAIYAAYWHEKQLAVNDLRATLWQKNRIWTQPDFASNNPGHGMRISCNVFNTEQDIDALVSALRTVLI